VLGVQEELRISIGLSNFRGPRIESSSILESVRVSLARDGRDLPIVLDRTTTGPAAGPYLAQGEGLAMLFTLRHAEGSAFETGSYSLSVSFAEVVRVLKTADGSLWSGQVKLVDQRQIIVREPRTKEELTKYWRKEGNDRLGKDQPLEAIRFLEPLAQELPDDWQAQGALGQAYLETRQYERAAAAFERALPGWLRFPERRGDLVPNALARSYLALRRDADAARVLRSVGVPENEVVTRLEALRRRLDR
jgi:tetratricopeptide (TPR) repeat protein